MAVVLFLPVLGLCTLSTFAWPNAADYDLHPDVFSVMASQTSNFAVDVFDDASQKYDSIFRYIAQSIFLLLCS